MKKLKQVSEMTDRELQESITENLRTATNNTGTIAIWMTFFGIVQVIGIVVLLLTTIK